MTDDKPPRTTRLYGAVDLVEEHYPPTIIEQARGRAATASPAAGTMLERYRIGQGGMGEVLSARDEQIGRTVAIKRLRV